MMGLTHAAFAGTLWTFTAARVGFDPDVTAAGMIVAVGAGVAPDLDEPQSSAARSAGWVGQTALKAARKAGRYKHRGPLTHSFLAAVAAVAVVAGVIAAGIPHAATGVTAVFALLGFGVLGGRDHRSKGAVVGIGTAVAAGWFVTELVETGWWLPAAVGIGWASHVLGDMLVGSSGVPAAWPVTNTRFALGVMRVGGKAETWVVAPLVYLAWVGAYIDTLDGIKVFELPKLWELV